MMASAGKAVFHFNGINGATGGYLTPPMTMGEVARVATSNPQEEEHLADLKLRYRQITQQRRRIKAGLDPRDLAQTGWGVIFAHEDREQLPALKEALAELLSLRQEQAGDLFREYSGVDAYRPGESKTNFLARHGAGPGPVDPAKVPYYLLIVGAPQQIPYQFQYQLDVQYAVGRLYFESLEAYTRYAESVVSMERRSALSEPRAVFFGVQNADDPATQLSATELVAPLAEKIATENDAQQWQVDTIVGEGATKAVLAELVGGARVPHLLFTASHGMGFPNGDSHQFPHQGALLCQDWPGPVTWTSAIPEAHYFAADDISDHASLEGLLAFHFACYGAGTPRMDEFAKQAFREPTPIAPHPFVARLPQRLLGHPKGGALAVIGHVERAWGYSFVWEKAGAQLAVFESALKRLMDGFPVGSAIEYFNERYAELSTVLSEELYGAQFGKVLDEYEIAAMWTANNDARSYVVIGDPAVRLPVSEGPEQPTKTPAGSAAAVQDVGESVERPTAAPPVVSPEAESDSIASIVRQLHDLVGDVDDQQALMLVHKAAQRIERDQDALTWARLQALQGRIHHRSQVGLRLENLKMATGAYRSALLAIREETASELWAETQYLLGSAFAELYAWTSETRFARGAERAYQRALAAPGSGEWIAGRAALHRDLAQFFLQRYEAIEDADLLERARESLDRALELEKSDAAPWEKAITHYRLGQLRIRIYQLSGVERAATEAIDELESALQLTSEELFPNIVAEAGRALGDFRLTLKHADPQENVERAIIAYKIALEAGRKLGDRWEEGTLLGRLGSAYSERHRGARDTNIEQAVTYFREGIAVLRDLGEESAARDLEGKLDQLKT